MSTNGAYPTQRRIGMFQVDDVACTTDQHCRAGEVCIKRESWGVGFCTTMDLPSTWIQHPMQWCTTGGRNAQQMGTTTLETCQYICVESCVAIEWWESDSACFECTNPSLKEDFNNTDDLDHYPQLYIKGSPCHSSVTSCPEFCESFQTDWDGKPVELCDCGAGCQCPGDGWCVVKGPSLPRCGFYTCPEECIIGEMSWEKKKYQSCQCTDDLCYIGARNEECQEAVEISTNIPVQASTILALPDGTSAGLCPEWSSPEFANGIWFKFSPSDTDSYRATTVSLLTTYDTQIAIFLSHSGDCSVLECLGSNDDFINLQSEVVFVAERETTIYIMVAGLAQAKGIFELSVLKYEDIEERGPMLNPDIHKLVDGCPNINGPRLDHFLTCVPAEEVATAMCCAAESGFCSSETYCSGRITYNEAKQFCVDVGDFHLCTLHEIENNDCCGSPCFNGQHDLWSSDQCADEHGIMEILYEAVGGASSQLAWDLPADHCTLDGLLCQYGRAISLVLSGMKLSGEIPSELGNLVNLLELDLSDNDLSGLIPKELSKLSNLSRLYLFGNQLTGPVPWEFGDFPHLLDLRLSDNQLLGWIPCELGKLENLVKLFLSDNLLSGSIPRELGNLGALVELDLSGNVFYGSNLNDLGNLPKLARLYLFGNKLDGTIPSRFGNLPRMKWLSLRDNQLSGTIPAEFGNLLNLHELDLSHNELSGPIPSNLGDLTTIKELDLSNNALSDVIPSELGNLEAVDNLDLSNNELSGSIPEELGNPQNLVSLHLSRNRLTGAIPSSLGSLSNIVELHLSHNELSGKIPIELGNPKRLALLNTEGNDALEMFPEMRCCFEIRHHYRTFGTPTLLGGSSGAGRLVRQYRVKNHKEDITVDIAMDDANLVCEYLGFRKAIVVFEGTPYGQGIEPYYIQTIQNGSVFTTGFYEAISLICDTGIDVEVLIGPGILILVLMLGVSAYTWGEYKKKMSSPSMLAKLFLWNSLRATLISLMAFDVILDILVAAQLHGTGQRVWFSISVVILGVSSVLLGLCFSSTRYYELQIYEVFFMCLIGHAIPVILFLHPLLSARMKIRYAKWADAATKAAGIPDIEHCPTKLTRFLKDRMDVASMFAIIERFSESIPQMMLQLSIATANRGITPLQGVSLLASLLSISTASVMFAWCPDNASVIFLLLCCWSDVLLLALISCMLSTNTLLSKDVFFMTKPVPLLMTAWAYTAFAVFFVMTLTSFYKLGKLRPRWSVRLVGVLSYFRAVPMFFVAILTGFITMLITVLLNFSMFVLEHTRMDKTCFSPDDLSSFLSKASWLSPKYLSMPFKEEAETSKDCGSTECISIVVQWNLRLFFKSKKTALLFIIFKLYLSLMVYLTYFYEHPGFGLYPLGTVVDVVAYTSVVLTILSIVRFPRFAKYRHFIINEQRRMPSNPLPQVTDKNEVSPSHSATHTEQSEKSNLSHATDSIEAEKACEPSESIEAERCREASESIQAENCRGRSESIETQKCSEPSESIEAEKCHVPSELEMV